MFKDKEILEELKRINKKLDRSIAMQNAKRLKERKDDSNELAWFIAVIILLLSFDEGEEENV